MFEDEASFQQEGTTRKSWAKRGIGFSVYHHPCKRRSKFYGAVTVQKKPCWHFQKADKFNAATFQAFLAELLVHHGRICLIVDNVRYHFAKKLGPFLRSNRRRLWLYRLPRYSPEINATEMVWRETRKDSTHNRYFPTTKGLTRAVQAQFRVYQREPQRLVGTVAQFLRA